MKACSDNNVNAIGKLKCVVGWIENIVGKEKMIIFQHFLRLSWDCVVKTCPNYESIGRQQMNCSQNFEIFQRKGS